MPLRTMPLRTMPPFKLAAERPSVSPQSTPPSSVRPVSVPPRPRSSPPSAEVQTDVAAQSAVMTPASPVVPQALLEPTMAPAAEAAPAIDLVPVVDEPATEAPASSTAPSTLEVSQRPASTSPEWPEAAQDTLRPSHVDLLPARSSRAFRIPRRSTLLAAAVVALSGVIGIVVSSLGSEPETIAALPAPALEVKPTRLPVAPPEPAIPPPSTAEARAASGTSGNPSGLVESAKVALAGAEDTVSVTVHVSPPNAAVFMRGQHFGTGEVTVKVLRGTKMTLFAQLDGYLPRTIVVDGTSKSVNIVLKRPQSVRAAAPRPVPVQGAVASSPESKSDQAAPEHASGPSEGASKSPDTAVADTPANSAKAPNLEPTKRSPSQSAGTGSEPMSDVDPL
jgi:hypothetical protein